MFIDPVNYNRPIFKVVSGRKISAIFEDGVLKYLLIKMNGQLYKHEFVGYPVDKDGYRPNAEW